MVYDANDERSFQEVLDWKKCIDQHDLDGIPVILVANTFKVSNPSTMVVSSERGQRRAADLDIDFFEVCSKKNVNITHLFTELGRKVVQPSPEQQPIDQHVDVDVEEKPKPSPARCVIM